MQSLLLLVVGALTGTLGTAIFKQFWDWFRDSRKTKKDAQFAALYLSVALESYAGDILTSLYQSVNYDASDGHAGSPMGNVPNLDLPDDLDWKALGIKITTIALTFKIKIESVASMISAYWEFDNDGETEVEARELAVVIALEAWEYAINFRRSLSLPPVEATDDRTTRTQLQELKEIFDTKRAEREARDRAYREAHPNETL